jgi:hypothetical protein
MKKQKKRPSKTRAKKLMPSRKYVNKILDWCLKTYGKSRYNKDFPEIQYRKKHYSEDDPLTMAFYDDVEGVIFIKKQDHPDMKTLANSIIHEYTHYKQNSYHYHILSMYLPYSRNPMEIEADRVANRDTKKCLREIFGQ